MIIKKKDLDFLKVYQSCANNADEDSSKLVIIKNGGVCNFILKTPDLKLVYDLPVIDDAEQFDLSLELPKFVAMLSYCTAEDEITITGKGTKFGGNSSYDFKSFNFDTDAYSFLKDMVIESEATYCLKDLGKLSAVDYFIGMDKETSCIAIQDNHFIAYNGYVLGIQKTENGIEENIYLSKNFHLLFKLMKLSEVTLIALKDTPYYYFEHGGIKIFLSRLDYSLPYIFDDDIKLQYEHPDYIECNTLELKNALSRISILSSNNKYARIYITFESDRIKIEIKDDYFGYENVSIVSKSSGFVTDYISCNSIQLYNIVSSLKEETFKLYCDADGVQALKIESNDDTKYVLTLYKKLDKDTEEVSE